MSGNKIILESGAIYNEHVEKQVFFTNQVTVTNQIAANPVGDDPVTATDPSEVYSSTAPCVEVEPYPASPYDDVLFRRELIMPAVKAELGRLMEEEKREVGTWNIVHWLVVWRVFHHFGFIEMRQSQSSFIRWVADVFGWEWSTKKFAGAFIPKGIKEKNLDEWTLDNICAQRPQAQIYLAWKNKLVNAFFEGNNDRKDCKSQFCTHWFSTQLRR